MIPEQQNEIDKIWQAINALQVAPEMPDHRHTGFDSSKVIWDSIDKRRLYVAHTIYGVDAATAGYYSTFFIAPFACLVTDFREVHAVAGSDGSAVTLQLEKLTGTTAPGSGVTVLKTALSLKATANTVQTATLTTTNANRNLAKNNRLALLKSGTLTAVANVTVLLELTVV